MIMMEPKEPCKFCGIKPAFYLGDKEYASYESRMTVVDGGWVSLYFGAEEDGTLFMSAAGEGETDHYHPKFCPECGRQLREVSSKIKIARKTFDKSAFLY